MVLIKKKELYLGTEIPKNIEEIKIKFTEEIYKERWSKTLEEIKKEYNKENRSIPESLTEKEIESFMIKFTYNTQRIEGSTLSLRETANLLEKGITPSEKPIKDVKEAEAHKNVFYNMLGYKKDLSLQICLLWNKLLLKETKPDRAGKIRNHHVAISQSKFIPPIPSELDFLLRDFFYWYKKNKNKLHPVVLAGLVHLRFVKNQVLVESEG